MYELPFSVDVGVLVRLALLCASGSDCSSCREWIITFGENRKFICGRDKPKLVTIATSIHEDSVHLDSPGHPSLRLPVAMDPKEGEMVYFE